MTASRRGLENGDIKHKRSVCVPELPSLSSANPCFFYRRFLNRSSEDDSASESCLPSEGATSDPVTLRRRMLAAAAERRLQKQQTS